MKLFLIQRTDIIGFDEHIEFVIRSPDEMSARTMAADASGDEGREVWIDPDLSTCTVLEPEGEAGVIVDSLRAG